MHILYIHKTCLLNMIYIYLTFVPRGMFRIPEARGQESNRDPFVL